MNEKVAVITGATSGIGGVAADALARQGMRIVFTARDPERGAATLSRLQAIAPSLRHEVHYADLSRIAQMKRAASAIAASTENIDVLINNAGLISGKRVVTEDGLELTFATNHMSYFVLTCLLRHRLSPGARIVSTSSAAHASGKLNFDDLQLDKQYSTMRAYSSSKLCNILFTRELARRLSGTDMTANCFHPGFVASRFGSNVRGGMALLVNLAKRFALSPQQGADTLIYLASSPQVATSTGGYYYKCQRVEPSPAARDAAAAERLWDVSSRLAGVGI